MNLGKVGVMRKLDLHGDLAILSCSDERLSGAIGEVGLPSERVRENGFPALLRIIVGQQVSVGAANSIEAKLRLRFPNFRELDFVSASDDDLRGCGLSRQKVGYVRGLAEAVLSGDLPLVDLEGMDDGDVVGHLTALRGFGVWSAENYCLFCLGRGDIFPADDLGLRSGLRLFLGMGDRPGGMEARGLAEGWSPYRSAMAIFLWHYYDARGKTCEKKEKTVR